MVKKTEKPHLKTPEHLKQARRWTFTSHGCHLPEKQQALQKWIDSNDNVLFFISSIEMGENFVHPHLQGYIEFKNPACPHTLINGHKELGLPHFHFIMSKGSKEDNIVYVLGISKTYELGTLGPTKNFDEKKDIPFESQFAWKCKQEDREDILKVVNTPYPYQKKILDMVEKPAHRRNIYWIWEAKGNTGKTHLCKYLCGTQGAIMTQGNPTDVKYAVARWHAIANHYPVTILINLTRTTRTQFDYKVLEELKDGLFFSNKYESGMTLTFKPPHIIVFSNTPPRIPTLSEDRWRVFKITPRSKNMQRQYLTQTKEDYSEYFEITPTGKERLRKEYLV